MGGRRKSKQEDLLNTTNKKSDKGDEPEDTTIERVVDAEMEITQITVSKP